MAVDTFVVTVRVVVAAVPPLGVTVAGANVHVLETGSPEHVKLTCWLNPETGVTLTVVVPVPAAATVIVVGFKPSVKLGVPTVCVRTADVDPVKFTAPP
jgi:hypothetical protein